MNFQKSKKKNIEIVRQHATTVLPLASDEEIWNRIVKDQHKEHAHLDEERLRQNFTDSLQFLEVYKNAADIIIETDGKTPKKVVNEIQKLLE